MLLRGKWKTVHEGKFKICMCNNLALLWKWNQGRLWWAGRTVRMEETRNIDCYFFSFFLLACSFFQDDCLTECCTVKSTRSLSTFQRCLLLPSSGWSLSYSPQWELKSHIFIPPFSLYFILSLTLSFYSFYSFLSPFFFSSLPTTFLCLSVATMPSVCSAGWGNSVCVCGQAADLCLRIDTSEYNRTSYKCGNLYGQIYLNI
jgi:hypothetical protein